MDTAVTTSTEFAHWATADPNGATGTLAGVTMVLAGHMGTAFYLHDDYPNFNSAAFTPPLPATGMVEIAAGVGHVFTVTFGGPIQDPVLLLGSFGSVLTFPPGTTVTRISGEDTFQVVGTAVIGESVNAADSNGTIQLTGIFTSITFTLVSNYGDGTGPDGVFLQIGGASLSTPEQKISGALTLAKAAALTWGDINALARELADRAVTEAAAGQAAAASVSQTASFEIISGDWSDPAGHHDAGDPEVAAAVAHAEQRWQAATTARARIATFVGMFDAVVKQLAAAGDAAPFGLADITGSLQGSATLCDFDDGFAPTATGPLTFGATKGTWTRGNLRVSVDPAGCKLPSATANVNPTSIIQGAFAQWQQVAAEVGRSFFHFTPVGVGQPAEIQVTFADLSGSTPPPPPGDSVAGSTQPPEHGIVRLDNSRTWDETELLSVALHEGGHALGLGHSNVPGTLMFPVNSFATVVDDLARTSFALLYGWLPRRDLSDRATNDRPSLHVVSRSGTPTDIPQMVWRGPLDDAGIWHAQFLNGAWTTQRALGLGNTSHSPALTAVDGGVPGIDIGTRLLMAWKGPGADTNIFWSRQSAPDGPWQFSGGATSHPVPNVGTSAAPSLATLNGQAFMAWKGEGADEQIWFASLDDAANNEVWGGQDVIADALTSDSPALVAWHNQLHLFWKDASDARAWHSVRGPNSEDIWGEKQQIVYGSFADQGSVTMPVLTDAPLAATARLNDIMVAWKGQNERPLHVSLFNGASFSGQAPIAQSGSIAGPAIAATVSVTFAAWKGNEGDRTLHWTEIALI